MIPEKINALLNQRPLILFDGLCPFCHFSVKLLIRFDKTESFLFAPILDKPVLTGIPRNVDSVILCRPGAKGEFQFYLRSDVLIQLAPQLKFPANLFGLLKWIPRWLRDGGYDVIARYRSRLFGRYAACPLPPARYRHRFIDLDE